MTFVSQSPQAIFMVRPSHFGYNDQTALSNAFQKKLDTSDQDISFRARLEFDAFSRLLISNGMELFVFDEDDINTPDAVFPNNWISFHHGGEIVLFPMLAENRRLERRKDIITTIEKNFRVNKILDLSFYEKEQKFLEGTGSVVIDYKNKIAYANRSPRTNEDLFNVFCRELGLESVMFLATDKKNNDIYHTNVLMTIADEFCAVCLKCIDKKDREKVVSSFKSTGHELIDISYEQMNHFVGNMIQLSSKSGERFLVMSKSAYEALLPEQLVIIENSCKILFSDISTIENYGGGSTRCMIAGIFLPAKNA